MVDREVSSEQSRVREQAARPETQVISSNWMTQATHDRLTIELSGWQERLEEARKSRISAHEDKRERGMAYNSQLEVIQSQSKIDDLREILRQGRIISPRNKTDKIKMGNSLLYRFAGEEPVSMAHMVGKHDIGADFIHPGQPIADAVMGKKAGESVTFTGGNKRQWTVEIIQVLPGQFEGPRENK